MKDNRISFTTSIYSLALERMALPMLSTLSRSSFWDSFEQTEPEPEPLHRLCGPHPFVRQGFPSSSYGEFGFDKAYEFYHLRMQ